MRDVELLIRFFGFHYFLEEYNGNLKQFLDLTCLTLNDRWTNEADELRLVAVACDDAIEATRRIFNGAAFRRYAENGVEGRFNRAIFDVMTFYFTEEETRGCAEESAESVVSAFKELCIGNPRFVEAITTTTKSIPATHARLQLWGETLGSALGIELNPPTLEGNRIRA
jgi:hypothetical protein